MSRIHFGLIGATICVAAGGLFLWRSLPTESESALPAPVAASQGSSPARVAPSFASLPVSKSAVRPTPESIAELAERNPAEAVRLALGFESDAERAAALHECLPQWLRADPSSARAWLNGQAMSFSADLLLAATCDAARVDPSFALGLAGRLPMGLRAKAVTEVFENWSGTFPAAAAQRAAELLNSRRDPGEMAMAETNDREVAVAQVAQLWGERDPRAAQAWALTLREPSVRRAALSSLTRTWAEADPAAAAAAIVQSLPPTEPGRVGLIDQLMTRWAEADAQAALDWVQTLTAPAEREAAATTLLCSVAQVEPGDAADWALHLSRNGASPLLGKVLAVWAANSPEAARAWAVARVPGSSFQSILDGTAVIPSRR